MNRRLREPEVPQVTDGKGNGAVETMPCSQVEMCLRLRATLSLHLQDGMS